MSTHILFDPSPEVIEACSAELGLAVPSAEERDEIVDTSRFQKVANSHIFTFDIPYNLKGANVRSGKISLVLDGTKWMIFTNFDTPGIRSSLLPLEGYLSSSLVFRDLLTILVDRLADGIEGVQDYANELSGHLFAGTELKSPKARESRYGDLVKSLAISTEHTAVFRQALMTVRRGLLHDKELDLKLIESSAAKAILRDIDSLNEHCTFVATRLTYFQDSVFGLLSVEQNRIIKIFSIAAVIFLPPTMFASIWGMNFEFMPELDESWGYPFAIGMMILSGIIPWRIFKGRGWM